MQLRIEERFSLSKMKKSMTEASLAWLCLVANKLLLGGDADQWLPRLGVARRNLEQQMVIDVNQTRAPLRAFQITRRPEQ